MDVIRRELQLKNLFYSYKNKRVFYCCQWRWPRPVFVAIRVFLGLYTILVLTGTFEEIYVYLYDSDTRVDWQGTIQQSSTEQTITEQGITEQGITEQGITEQGITEQGTTQQGTTQQSTIEQSTIVIKQGNATDYWYYVGRWSQLVFFTEWSYILLTIHMVLAAFLSIAFYKSAETGVTKFRPNPAGVIVTHSDNQMELLGADNPDTPGVVPQTFNSDTGKTYVPIVDNCWLGNELTTSTESEGATRNSAGRRMSSSESNKLYHKEHMSLKTPLYFKISWCLSNINSVWASIVTTVFFAALCSQNASLNENDLNYRRLSLTDHNRYTLNFVFVLVDHLVSPRPVRLLHFVAPLVFGLIYVIFSVVYWSRDHVNHVVYKNVLDWNYPGIATGFYLGLSLVAIPLLQLFFFAFYQLKCRIHRKLYGCSFCGGMD